MKPAKVGVAVVGSTDGSAVLGWKEGDALGASVLGVAVVGVYV